MPRLSHTTGRPVVLWPDTNRANVRIARGDYAGAVADYEKALQLAPLATDAWVTYLNRGSTLLAMGRSAEALSDLSLSVNRLGHPTNRHTYNKTWPR